MPIIYEINGEELDDRPEIRVGEATFAVDNRLRTFERINAGLKNMETGEFEFIIRNALGDDAYGAISEMNPPLPLANRIVTLIMAAMQGVTEEEASRRFQRGDGRDILRSGI
jgi:hypothetical protein